ncbi:MAG: hypothetical protein ACTHZ5_11090 [Micrococcaceae bacterium]
MAVMFLVHRWDHLRTLNRAMDCLLDIVLTHDGLCGVEDGRDCFVCATVMEFNPVEAVECLELNRDALRHEFGDDACRPLDQVVYDAGSAFSFDRGDVDLDDFCQTLMERCVDEQSLVHGLHTVLRGVVADDGAARQRFETMLAELRTDSELAGEDFFRQELISDEDDQCWLLDRGWSSYRLHCQIMTAMEAYMQDETTMPAE